MNRVFFDANTGTSDTGFLLYFDQSKIDLQSLTSGPKDGTIVTLYMPNELEVEAKLQFDKEFNCWKGIPIGPFREI